MIWKTTKQIQVNIVIRITILSSTWWADERQVWMQEKINRLSQDPSEMQHSIDLKMQKW